MTESPQPRIKVKLWTRGFVIIAITNMMAFFGFNMTTVGMPLYVSMLGGSDFIVGLVTTLSTGAAVIIRPFSGFILDRFDRRNVLVLGLIIMAVTTLAYAVFPLMGIIIALRVIHGVGWGFGSSATTTLAADSIPRNRFAEGMGYVGLAASVAIAIAPALAVTLLQQVGANAMIFVAAASSVVALALAFFFRISNTQAQPAHKNESLSGGIRGLKLSDLFDRRALLPASMTILVTFSMTAISTFLVLHANARGVEDVSLYFIVYAVVLMISRPIVGRFIDKVGFFIPGIIAMFGFSISLLLISVSSSLPMFCVAGGLAGLGLGTSMSNFQAMSVAAAPSQRRGVAMSTYLFGLDTGVAVGAMFSGFISGIFGYATMYIAMTVFPLIGCIIFIVLGKKKIDSYSETEL